MNKQYILDQIRRTAEANNGAPLGTRTFAKETGIKGSDWLGRYWARWSDAVKEAGLAPNEKQSAFIVDEMIEQLIALAREYGRLPFKTEMQLKAHTDNKFPSLTTIYERIGNSKTNRAKRMREYCTEKNGYDDIVAMCDDVLAKSTSPSTRAPENEPIRGFVYLIKSGRHYKVGRSISVGQRERQLTIQLPDKAITVHSIATDDPAGIEAYWHKRFESKRKNGEWFDLDTVDVSAFRRRKFM